MKAKTSPSACVPLFFLLFSVSGGLRLASAIIGAPNILNSYSDDLALFIFSVWYFIICFKRKTVLYSPESLLIIAYITIRVVYLLLFSATHKYGVINYLFPIKNWFTLLLAFLCGREMDFSFASIKDYIIKYMRYFILVCAFLQLVAVVINSDFMRLGGGISRFSFIRYRMGISNYLMLFYYYFITIGYIRNEIRNGAFIQNIVVFMIGILLCQAKNVLFGVLLINIVIALSIKTRMSRKKLSYILLVIPPLLSLGIFAIIAMVRENPIETALSLGRRLLLVDYVKTHFIAYPIMGYPIPAFSFPGTIPADIVDNFISFDFQKTIFPSDFPALFVLSEEGVLGYVFLVVFWSLVIRKNKATGIDMLLIQLSAILVFPAYAFLALPSSVVFYLLGITSANRRSESCQLISD
jgi:hypothetical protein